MSSCCGQAIDKITTLDFVLHAHAIVRLDRELSEPAAATLRCLLQSESNAVPVGSGSKWTSTRARARVHAPPRLRRVCQTA